MQPNSLYTELSNHCRRPCLTLDYPPPQIPLLLPWAPCLFQTHLGRKVPIQIALLPLQLLFPPYPLSSPVCLLSRLVITRCPGCLGVVTLSTWSTVYMWFLIRPTPQIHRRVPSTLLTRSSIISLRLRFP